MRGLLKLSATIDRVLTMLAHVGIWFGVLLVITVIYDVVTRHFGLPRGFGINATQVQESEYWMHTIFFAFVIGHAYKTQSHVRIDLIRERLPMKVRYAIEVFGCAVFLIPYCLVAGYYTFAYTVASYGENEVSKSVIGLSHIWVLKSFVVVLYLLLGLAGLSQLIKALAGAAGRLPEDKISETIGGDL